MEKNMTTLEKLVYSAFWIDLNANDFFHYASADIVRVDTADFIWILPIMEKYPNSGLNACMAYIRKQEPIKPYLTEEYKLAYKELKSLNPHIQSED